MKGTRMLLALVLLLAGGSASAGQMGPDFEVGLGAGAGIPLGNLAEQDHMDLLETGWTLQGWVTGPIGGGLAWRAELGNAWLGYANEVTEFCQDCDDARVFHYGGGLQYNLGMDSDVRPYVFWIIGGYHVDPNLPGEFETDSETYFGTAFGGGVNFLVGESWGLGGDVHFHYFFPGDDAELFDRHNDEPWYITPTAQVFWRF